MTENEIINLTPRLKKNFKFYILKFEFSNLTITNSPFQYCNTVIIFLFYSKTTIQQFIYQNIIYNVCNNILD